MKVKNKRSKNIFKLDKEQSEAIMRQREAFIKKFGREPTGDDPIFFDPDKGNPEPFSLQKFQDEIEKAMISAGINPALIYATKKTGLIVTRENQINLSKEDLKEWNDAVAEFEGGR